MDKPFEKLFSVVIMPIITADDGREESLDLSHAAIGHGCTPRDRLHA